MEEPGHLVRKNRVEHGYMKGKIDGEPDLMDRVVRARSRTSRWSPKTKECEPPTER